MTVQGEGSPRAFTAPAVGDLAAEIVFTTGAQAIALLGPQFGIPAAAAAPALAAASSFVGQWWANRRTRAATVVALAAKRADGTAEALLDRASDPQRQRLTFEAMKSATTSDTDAHLIALARCLADGLITDSREVVDREILIAVAMGELQPIHVRVMSLISVAAPDYVQGETPPAGAGWTNAQVEAEYPESAGVLPAIVAALTRQGIISDIGVGTLGNRTRIILNEFGYLCLSRLREAGGAPLP